MLPLTWSGPISVSQSKWLANWKGDRLGKRLWRQRSLKVQGSNNPFRLSTLEPGHLVETGTFPARENSPVLLIEIFIGLSSYNSYNSIGY
jgi:hypothetical protein